MIGYLVVGAILLVGLFLGYTFLFPAWKQGLPSWKALFTKREGFQDTVAGGTSIKVSKEMCEKLKAGIDQYTKVRKEHPDTEIRNLDETLEKMNEYYTTYGCDTY